MAFVNVVLATTAGLEVRVAFGSVWKESLTELSGGQRSLLALSLILALCRCEIGRWLKGAAAQDFCVICARTLAYNSRIASTSKH